MIQKRQSELQFKAEKEKEEVKQPHKKRTKADGNGDKKVESIACQRVDDKRFFIVLYILRRLVQGRETVANGISKERTTQISQNEKDRGYEIRKEGTDDDDQLFHGQELYHYTDTSHRIGTLCVDYYDDPNLLSAKLVSLLLSQVCFLGIVGRYSCPATGVILNKAEIVWRFGQYFTPTAKDANNQQHVSDLQGVERYYFNSGLKDSYEMEDIPEQGKNQKKTPPFGSGIVLEKHAEDIEQCLPSEKNSPLYKRGCAGSLSKKNILYLTEESYFDARHEDMTYDHHTSIGMHVSDQSVIESRRSSSGCAPHIIEEVERKRSFKYGDSWIGRGIPGSSGGKGKVKQKEELGEINGIDNNFPDHGDLKKRKNSIDQFPDRHEDDRRHFVKSSMDCQMDPQLKIGVALLSCPPGFRDRIRTSQQGQDCADEQGILSAVTEESHQAEENHGEGQHEAAGQSLSAEDSQKHKASSAEGGEACHAKHQDAEELADCAAGSAATATDHGKDTHTVGGAGHHPPTLEDFSFQSVSTGTRVSDSQSQGKETPWERGTRGKGAMPEAVSLLRRDQSRGMGSTATGNAGGSACCVKDDADLEEDGSADPHAAGQEVDTVPPEKTPALPVSQTRVERTADCGTPQPLSAPVQVSSPGNSELSVAGCGCSEFSADETYERSFVPTPDEDRRPDYAENSHPVTGVESGPGLQPCPVPPSQHVPPMQSESFLSNPSPLQSGPSPLQSGPSPLQPGPSPLQSGPSLQSGLSPLQSGPSPLQPGPSPLQSGPSPLQPGPSPLQSGPSPLQSRPSPLQSGPGSHPPSPQHLPPVTVPPSQSLPVRSETSVSNPSPAQSLPVRSETSLSNPSPAQSLPVRSETSLSNPSPAQPGPGYAPGPVSQPPVTVHAACALPPRAPRAARINLARATNREFVMLGIRRATFDENWPSGEDSGIDASNMALSGFYIEDRGRGHRVRCFFCGLVLDNLTSAHNIWDEHVRHRPDCDYLNALMGSDFVQKTLRNLPPDHDHDHDRDHSQAP